MRAPVERKRARPAVTGASAGISGQPKVGEVYSKSVETATADEVERVIQITAEPFGSGFDIRILPPVPGEDFDMEMPTYRMARGWASGLRMTRGWRIVDLAGEGA